MANLMLTEGKQGLPAIADPIRSRNVMETCPAEFSAVWAYNPYLDPFSFSFPAQMTD